MTLLPSVADLALSAAKCAVPCLLWVINLDLIITARAGQLAALFPECTGQHLFDVLTTDDPRGVMLSLYRRAFLGEVVHFQHEAAGREWSGSLAPIVDRRIWGVVGSASLVSARRGTDPEQPFVYQVTRDLWGFREGEIITRPRTRGPIRRHDNITLDDFDGLLAAAALTPVPSVAAYETDERVARVASDPVRRLPRGFRRLSLA